MENDFGVEMRNITKTFPGVSALSDVTVKVRRGDIHAIVGENGAGKSTLMKILCGYYPAGSFSGGICIDGKPCGFESVTEAERHKVVIIFQELNLARNLSVTENLFLGRYSAGGGIVRWNAMHEEAERCLRDVGLNINPETQVEDLTIGKRQSVEIARALHKNASILILDEPTSSLAESEVENLFKILSLMKKRGVTCIYISHKLHEVFRIADTITVLRDGHHIRTAPREEFTQADVISLMVGRKIQNLYPNVTHHIGEVVLQVRNMTLTAPEGGKKVVRNVNLQVREGEILGVAGLIGAGRTEMLFGVFGAFKGKCEGEVHVGGKQVEIRNPSDAIDNGIFLVPEDRRLNGLVMNFSVGKNITLASLAKISRLGILNQNDEARLQEETGALLAIKTTSYDAEIGNLSGGNQQKVIVARWLARSELRVLFLDDPTNGIDVGAKFEMYGIMNDLAQKGVGVVLVSSELPELLGVCDRIVVMRDGEITGEYSREEADEEKIMYSATIGKNQRA